MKVKAAPGLKCPMEKNARRYISDDAPVDVPESSYYRRLLADGSLVAVPDPPQAKARKAKGVTTDGIS